MSNITQSQFHPPNFSDFRQPFLYGFLSTTLISTAFYLPSSVSTLILLLLAAIFVVDLTLCFAGFKHQATFRSLLALSTVSALLLGFIDPDIPFFVLLLLRNLGLAYLTLQDRHIALADIAAAILSFAVAGLTWRNLSGGLAIIQATLYLLTFLLATIAFRSLRTFMQTHARLSGILAGLKQENKRLKKDQLRFQREHRYLEQLGIMKERARLGRELHDTVVHAQSAIVIQLEAALRVIQQQRSDAETFIQQARNIARSSMEDIRRSLRAMRPSEFEVDGLVGLSAMVEEFSQRTGIAAQVDFSNFQRPEIEAERLAIHSSERTNFQLDRLREEALYSTLQEALSNAQRHAPHCTRIDVRLSSSAHAVILEVENDGCTGPIPQPLKKGIGLKGMQERAKECQGSLQWYPSSTFEHGFLLRLTLPWPKPDEREGVAL